MEPIRYERLSARNFTAHSLDRFIRHQTVREVWRETDGVWRLLSSFLPDNEGSITLGIMFMLMSLLCRHGAEQKEA